MDNYARACIYVGEHWEKSPNHPATATNPLFVFLFFLLLSLATKSIDLCVWSMEKMDLWRKQKNNTQIKLSLRFSVFVPSVLSG